MNFNRGGRGGSQRGRPSAHGRFGRGARSGRGKIEDRNGGAQLNEYPARPQRKHPIGYKHLEELLEEEPAELILKLGNQGTGFLILLHEDHIRDDLIALAVRVLARTCESKRCRSNFVTLLTEVSKSPFLKQHLPDYVLRVSERVDHVEPNRFKTQLLACILNLCRVLLETFQRTACEELMLLIFACQRTVLELRKAGSPVNVYYEEDLNDLATLRKELSQRNVKVHEAPTKNKLDDLHNLAPPEDFREIPVIPTLADIRAKESPFVRPNLVAGRYANADHYLDVQFRLLREDFVAPLREGIDEYLAEQKLKIHHKTNHFKDIFIYENVHILHSICIAQGIAHRLQFDVGRLQHVRWEASKRLIFGSLICLSKDNFENVLFATVVNREVKDLQCGLIDVRFEHGMDKLHEISLSDAFLMAETHAYFESYRHVLKGLQDTTEESLPMKQYLVAVSKAVHPPVYLNEFTTYDLLPLIRNKKKTADLATHSVFDSDSDSDSEVSIKGSLSSAQKVRLLHNASWPSADELNLDSSQWHALHSALTREFALIQGPPGTGKTFIGLKIVSALLHNRKKWMRRSSQPILVVCYTNHALDQFLEGIASFTKKIVRVGGRSSSEALQPYNLRNLREERRKNRKTEAYIHHGRRDLIHTMKSHQRSIGQAAKLSENASKGVLHENELMSVISDFHYDSLKIDFASAHGFVSAKPQSFIVEWLCLTSSAPLSAKDIEFMKTGEISETVLEQEGENAEEIDVEVAEEAELEATQRFLDADDDFLYDGKNVMENVEWKLAARFEDLLNEQEEVDDGEWRTYGNKKLKKRLLKRELQSTDAMTPSEVARVANVWHIDLHQRWRLYRYWIAAYRQALAKEVRRLEAEYEQDARNLKEVRDEEDLAILRLAKVVGMTTTGTARLHSLLQQLRPAIVIVEEAAEVLEAHIVTSLTEHCQHLILIGDHQQLRPNPTVYKLAKDYHLDISLFERLIKNGVQCDRLDLQHRMRPTISRLLVPHIYPDLKDHPDVMKYENIKGVCSNLFFVDHDVPEAMVSDSKSKANEYEARYITELCLYFRLQGYEAEQITVLTTYLGQLYIFKRLMKKRIFSGVHVTAVDNYQGEENDIILLSLVRSNIEGSIGFLKISNRVCVALSRAKKGLFVIGNFQLLAEKEKLWKNIVAYVESKNWIGPALKAVCQNHPDAVTYLRTPEDFRGVPEGGCGRPCEYRLNCGHQCPSVCHPTDKEHLKIQCRKPCGRIICKKGHKCNLKCYQECGNCKELVKKLMPLCGHELWLPCSQDPETVECTEPCHRTLQCGHKCKNTCSMACQVKCETTVLKRALCGHPVRVACYETYICSDRELSKFCTIRCGAELSCGHLCSGTCGTCRQGRLHESCQQACQRPQVCGHLCTEPCAKNCPPCKRQCENRCPHTRCPQDCSFPCVPCREPCIWQCVHHKCSNLCSEPCNRQPCNKPCSKFLRCNHPCIGLCGEPCPKKCRFCNQEEVTEIFFGDEDDEDACFVELEDCGHVFEVHGLDKWMKLEPIGKESQVIKMKSCPKCSQEIRQNLRYGQTIKATLNDIYAIKKRVFGEIADLDNKRADIKTELAEDRTFQEMFSISWKQLLDRSSKSLSYMEVNVLENQVNFFSEMAKVSLQLNELPTDEDYYFVKEELEFMERWLMKHAMKLPQQELEEFNRELNKMTLLVLLKHNVKSYNGIQNLNPKSRVQYNAAYKLLMKLTPFLKEDEQSVKDQINEIKRLQGGLGISPEEKDMIVKALNLGQGHWFKCPKGHYYIITECGGPMVEGRCPDCKAAIGGGRHALRSDNQFAPEMDNARFPAYSTRANLDNYDMAELQRRFGGL